MTEQEQKAFTAMREALMAAEFHLVEMGQRGNGLHKQCEDAITAANAVSHPQATEPQAQPSSFDVEAALVAQSKAFMGSR